MNPCTSASAPAFDGSPAAIATAAASSNSPAAAAAAADADNTHDGTSCAGIGTKLPLGGAEAVAAPYLRMERVCVHANIVDKGRMPGLRMCWNGAPVTAREWWRWWGAVVAV